VITGQAQIAKTAPTTLTVKQTSSQAIIDWTTFSIGANETTVFQQPQASSVTLNRVTGNDASIIDGALKANGKIFLINPDGVIFGHGANVNVGGLLVTTTDITNNDFMAGRLNFTRPGKSTATIGNQGNITVVQGGLAAFVAPGVANSGVITARLGQVALASGNKFTLDLYGDRLVKFAVDDKVFGGAVEPASGARPGQVRNSGSVLADGGTVQLTVSAAQNVVDNVINQTGYVRAQSASMQNGKIVLDGGAAGTVLEAGALDASGTSAGATGGAVQVLGNQVTVASTAQVDASGDAGGGAIRIGGDFHGANPKMRDATLSTVDAGAVLNVDAIEHGDGGTAVVWSNGHTEFSGLIESRANNGSGGVVEVSGHELTYKGFTDARSAFGHMGSLLLDPYDVTISTGPDTGSGFTATANDTNINVTTLTTALTGAAVTVSTGGGGTQAGNITINSTVPLPTNADLTLSAAGNILFNQSVAGDKSTTLNLYAANSAAGGSIFGSAPVSAGTINVKFNGGITGTDAFTPTGWKTNKLSFASGYFDVNLTGMTNLLGTPVINVSNWNLTYGAQKSSLVYDGTLNFAAFSVAGPMTVTSTAGDITFNQALVLTNDLTVMAAKGTTTFGGVVYTTITGASAPSLSVNALSILLEQSIGWNANAVAPLNSLTVSGTTTINPMDVSNAFKGIYTVGAQTFNGPVVLGGVTPSDTIILSSQASIVFNSTVDAVNAPTGNPTSGFTGVSLDLFAPSGVTFNRSVGSIQPLLELNANNGFDGRPTIIAGASVSTFDSQYLDDAIIAAPSVTLNAGGYTGSGFSNNGNVLFNAIDGAAAGTNSLVINARNVNGIPSIGFAIGATKPLLDVTITGNTSVGLNDSQIATIAGTGVLTLRPSSVQPLPQDIYVGSSSYSGNGLAVSSLTNLKGFSKIIFGNRPGESVFTGSFFQVATMALSADTTISTPGLVNLGNINGPYALEVDAGSVSIGGTLGGLTPFNSVAISSTSSLIISNFIGATGAVGLVSGGTLTLNDTVSAPEVILKSGIGQPNGIDLLSGVKSLGLSGAISGTIPSVPSTVATLAINSTDSTNTDFLKVTPGGSTELGSVGPIGPINGFSGITTQGESVIVNSTGALNVAYPINVGSGSVGLESGGDITLAAPSQAGPGGVITANEVVLDAASGNINLSNANLAGVTSLGLKGNLSGTLSIPSNVKTIAVDTTGTNGALTIAADGTLTFGALTPIGTGSDVVQIASGITSAGDAVTVSAPGTLTITTLNSRGNFTVSNAGAVTIDSLNIGGAVTIENAGTVQIDALKAGAILFSNIADVTANTGVANQYVLTGSSLKFNNVPVFDVTADIGGANGVGLVCAVSVTPINPGHQFINGQQPTTTVPTLGGYLGNLNAITAITTPITQGGDRPSWDFFDPTGRSVGFRINVFKSDYRLIDKPKTPLPGFEDLPYLNDGFWQAVVNSGI
jgi:filamentous hemagglutinin family protein